MLRTCPVKLLGHRVDGIGQVLPRAGDARHQRLAAELAVGADLARHARDFTGKGVELVDHRVDGLLQLQDFAADVHGDFLRQIAAGDGGRHLGDVAHLGREIARHEIDVVGEIFPRSGDARHLRLAAELAFGTDLARHARHFRGEGIELIDHGVDRILELENFAAHVDRDLPRQVAACHRRRHLRDVAHLVGEIAAHRVHRIRSRSFHVPATPGTMAWPPSFPSVPTSRATRVTSEAKERS